MKRNEKPIIESDKRNHEVLNYDRKSGNGGVFGTLRMRDGLTGYDGIWDRSGFQGLPA